MGSGISSGRRRSFGAGASGGMLPLLALQVLIEYGRVGASRPPVTAALLAANALIYLRPGALDGILPSLTRVSFNPRLIIEYGDLVRFFLSPFYHLSESHLFYNMTSLLWKGIQLETSMGSVEFASMVAVLLGLSQGITLLLSKGLLLLGDYTAYYNQYAVGFSGVLFAMKIVLNAWSEDFVYLHGMVIPAKYAAWAELILIQVFIPGTSFLGLSLAEACTKWARSGHSSDVKHCKSRDLAIKICSESSMVCPFTGTLYRSGQGWAAAISKGYTSRVMEMHNLHL